MKFPQVMTQHDIFTALHSLAFGSLSHTSCYRETVLAYDEMMQKLRVAEREDALAIVESHVSSRGYTIVEHAVTWGEFMEWPRTALALCESGYAIATHAGHVYKNTAFDIEDDFAVTLLECVEVNNEKAP